MIEKMPTKNKMINNVKQPIPIAEIRFFPDLEFWDVPANFNLRATSWKNMFHLLIFRDSP